MTSIVVSRNSCYWIRSLFVEMPIADGVAIDYCTVADGVAVRKIDYFATRK